MGRWGSKSSCCLFWRTILPLHKRSGRSTPVEQAGGREPSHRGFSVLPGGLGGRQLAVRSTCECWLHAAMPCLHACAVAAAAAAVAATLLHSSQHRCVLHLRHCTHTACCHFTCSSTKVAMDRRYSGGGGGYGGGGYGGGGQKRRREEEVVDPAKALLAALIQVGDPKVRAECCLCIRMHARAVHSRGSAVLR